MKSPPHPDFHGAFTRDNLYSFVHKWNHDAVNFAVLHDTIPVQMDRIAAEDGWGSPRLALASTRMQSGEIHSALDQRVVPMHSSNADTLRVVSIPDIRHLVRGAKCDDDNVRAENARLTLLLQNSA